MHQPVIVPLTRDAFLYEDADILAVEKPIGLATIPERDLAVPSLKSELEKLTGTPLFIVHRLDKDVSGVVLFAKTAAAHRHLSMQFTARDVAKSYLALAHGRLPQDTGDIRFSIRQFGSGRMGVDARAGKPCHTQYETRERFNRFTLVEVHPVTGRRHQLRVHFFAIGHPLVGDPRYGEPATQRQYPRLMLHAQQIEFSMLSGETRLIESRTVDAFLTLCRKTAGRRSKA